MCSVLIFVKPENDHADPALDWQKFKAGDVVDIAEKDNFYWGDDIQGPSPLGWWSVVVVPKTQKSRLTHLMDSGEMPLVSLLPANPVEVRHQKRLWAVDTTALAPSMTLPELLAVASRKPAMSNSNVIG
jgi:hypothetical protein